MEAALVALLREARDEIADARDLIVFCMCMPGDDGVPDRATLAAEPDGEAEVLRMEALLARIDAALAGLAP